MAVADVIRSQVVVEPPDDLDTDIAIIGSGMGGGTLSYALRDTGARVLLIEQGDFLPVERENWSFEAVHLHKRYKNSASLARPGHRKRLSARQLSLRGRQHQALRRDIAEILATMTSSRLSMSTACHRLAAHLCRPRTVLRRRRADVLGAQQQGRRPNRSVALHRLPLCRDCPRRRHHPTCRYR